MKFQWCLREKNMYFNYGLTEGKKKNFKALSSVFITASVTLDTYTLRILFEADVVFLSGF